MSVAPWGGQLRPIIMSTTEELDAFLAQAQLAAAEASAVMSALDKPDATLEERLSNLTAADERNLVLSLTHEVPVEQARAETRLARAQVEAAKKAARRA